MDYWNAAEAEVKGPYQHRDLQGKAYIISRGTPALLHRSQAPFRKPSDHREWVTITPFAVKECSSGGVLRTRRVPMFEDSHPKIVIPACYLRMKVRIIRDFVPGVPEYDHIAVIATNTLREMSIFRKGDVVLWENVTLRPAIVIEVRCRRRTLEGFEPFEGAYPIHHSFVQFGIPPEPEPEPESNQKS